MSGKIWSKERRARFEMKRKAKQINRAIFPGVLETQPAQDSERNAQYNYRRGLFAAIDVILRELRHS